MYTIKSLELKSIGVRENQGRYRYVEAHLVAEPEDGTLHLLDIRLEIPVRATASTDVNALWRDAEAVIRSAIKPELLVL